MDLGRGGINNPGPSGYGGGYNATTSYSGGDGGNTDPYQGFVAASQPRGGLNAIKNYFTGDGYDYGYQRTFGKDLLGLKNLLFTMNNPVLALLKAGYDRFKPELETFKNSLTLEDYLNNRKNLTETPKTTKPYIDITKSIPDSDIESLQNRIARTTGYNRDQIKTVSDLALVNRGPFYFGAQTDPEVMVTGGANLGPFNYNVQSSLNDLGRVNQSANIGIAPGVNYYTDFDGINSLIGSRTFETPFGPVNIGGQYDLNTDNYGIGLNFSRQF